MIFFGGGFKNWSLDKSVDLNLCCPSYHEVSHDSVRFHGVSRDSMRYPGVSRDSVRCPGVS